ncbi:hypothetical protein NQT62_12115 [Limnobacter humi]|uniref:Surface antigen domain-containing protein n=1 Tax=Limnobacter humi TaxID=1778671 RepID=A0ABT1WID9_9BURK|nr:hypothetical protein [Limnobacter humi]MCQ8897179.1 hypothetical protein [Limnobacter humi]
MSSLFGQHRSLSLLLGFALACGAGIAAARNFIGYTGKGWVSDYGVLKGECNVPALIGPNKKPLPAQMAMVDVDAAFDAVLPNGKNDTARQLDAQCFGHTLELVPTGQAVRWVNPLSGNGVYLSPGAKSDTCRTYLGVLASSGQKSKFRGEACSTAPGVWKIQP